MSDSLPLREQLIAVYGESVRSLPVEAIVVEHEFPDGSGSWGWCLPDELQGWLRELFAKGCTVWVDGSHVL